VTTKRTRGNVAPAKRAPLTDVERARIVELVGTGLSCGEVAREVGRHASTVSRVARDAGLSFDRSQTAAATEAKQADAAERLVAGVGRWLDARDEALDTVLGRMASMPARDVREFLVAAGVAQDKAAGIVDRLNGTNNAAEAASLLGDLVAGFRNTYQEPESDADTSDVE
jgi:transposase-like protein